MRAHSICSLALALAVPVGASAHELPKGIGLAWPSGSVESTAPAVLTNRGLIFPVENPTAGGAYALRCSEAYDVTTTEVPSLMFDSSGEDFLLVTSKMVARSADRGCTFERFYERTDEHDVLGGFTVRTTDPEELLLSTVDPERQSKVLASTDFGKTWSVRYENAPGELYQALSAAPSDPQRVYASGFKVEQLAQQTQVSVLWARSDDGGESWELSVLEQDRELVGVHPTNPDVVFVWEWADAARTKRQVLRSADGGMTFTPVLQGQGTLSFAASSDAGTLWLGVSLEGGLYRSTDDGASFEKVLPELLEVDCIVPREDALWLCANREGVDGIWRLPHDGQTLESILTFDQVTTAVACEEKPDVCQVPWLDWQLEIFPDGLPTDAGTGNAPSDAGVASDAGSQPGGDDAGIVDPGAGGDDGCAVRAPSDRRSAQWSTFAALVGLGLALRRRARRAR